MAASSASVHAILGGESLLAEEALEAILKATLGTDRETALKVLRGDETTWSRLVDDAGMGSLFAEKRVLVVRNADALKGDGEEMQAYLDDPTPGVTLVLLAAKADKRTKIWKRIVEKAAVVPADAPKGRGLRAFAEERLRQRKLRLSEEGVFELLERVGQDLRRLVGEIDKLEAFFETGAKASLSGEDVAAVLGRGMAQPLYKLGDAFCDRRGAATLALLYGLLEEGEPAQKILATLHRSLRQLRGARALQEQRKSREEILRRLQIMPFKLGDVLKAAGCWSEADFARAIVALGEADRRMKTGVSPEVALGAAVVAASLGARAPGALAGGRGASSSPRTGR